MWGALYGALLDEVIPSVGADVHELMVRDHEDFCAAVDAFDMQGIATTNFTFFSQLTAVSTNEALRRAITSVVHIVRLGSLHLPDYVDFQAIERAQAKLIAAVGANDVALAHDAIAELRAIRIPVDPE